MRRSRAARRRARRPPPPAGTAPDRHPDRRRSPWPRGSSPRGRCALLPRSRVQPGVDPRAGAGPPFPLSRRRGTWALAAPFGCPAPIGTSPHERTRPASVPRLAAADAARPAALRPHTVLARGRTRSFIGATRVARADPRQAPLRDDPSTARPKDRAPGTAPLRPEPPSARARPRRPCPASPCRPGPARPDRDGAPRRPLMFHGQAPPPPAESAAGAGRPTSRRAAPRAGTQPIAAGSRRGAPPPAPARPARAAAAAPLRG